MENVMSDWMTEEEAAIKNMDPAAADAGTAPEQEVAPGAEVQEAQDAPQTPDNAPPVENTPTDVPQVDAAEGEPLPATDNTHDTQAADAVADQRIPKARFDEVNTKKREAEEQAKRLAEENRLMREALQQLAAPQEPQKPQAPSVKDLRKQYHAALLEGDMDKAEELSDVMDNIRRAEIEREILSRAMQETQQYSTAQQEQARFNQTLNNVLADFPQFVENSPEYNEEATMQAYEVAKGLIAAGHPQVNAMLRAVELTTRAYGIQPKSAQVNQPPQAAPAVPQTVQRAPTTVQQPPSSRSVGSAGKPGALPDIANMSYEEYESLPKDVIARLKGM
jgi:flagellar hook-basal body complex protein FliE